MAQFRERNEQELDRLSDEELIEYIVAARGAGKLDAARVGLQVLVKGYMPNIERRVQNKMPEGDDAAIDEVAGNAMLAALAAAFSGGSIGEFRSWLHTIVDRRIADWWRRKRLERTPLADEHEGDEDFREDAPLVEDETGAVDVRT